MIKKIANHLINKCDGITARAYLSIIPERKSLMVFLFHALFKNREEANSGILTVSPEGSVTVDDFYYFVEYYHNQGYVFVTPDEIINGLDDKKKYALITFDDGYYNNRLALPILNKFNAPAVFFVSTGHITEGKAFWWDVLYRERVKRSLSRREIMKELAFLKTNTSEEIERYIKNEFGEDSLKPLGDTDRPLTPKELRDFSKETNVFIGNHTNNHAILTNLNLADVEREIIECQEKVYNITSEYPRAIAYPEGWFSESILKTASKSGLGLGVTTIPKKNYFPINPNNLIALNRFVLSGGGIKKQCELFRSDLRPRTTIRRILNKPL